jgi:hypothetical protein
MLRLPAKLVRWLKARGFIEAEFIAAYIDEMPDESASSGEIFIERRNGFVKWAHFKCPKCEELISVPIGRKTTSWTISIDRLWRPTLRPSIWETESCGAHFVVTGGRLRWCIPAKRSAHRASNSRLR